MTSSRSEEILVGLIALALVPLIGWKIRRALRDGRISLYRGDPIRRDDRPGRFRLLLVLHALALVLIAAIAADLLFDLGFQERS